jgi:pyruvate dehydrogenase E1 component
MGGAVWRKRLMDDLGDQGDVTALIESRSDDELAELMEQSRRQLRLDHGDAFDSIDHDRPTCFLAYTIKGWGTPIAGHKDNHGGLMNPAQMAEWQRHMGVPEGEEWEKFATVEGSGRTSGVPRPDVPFFAKARRRYSDHVIATPQIEIATDREISTQAAFGKILDTCPRPTASSPRGS